MANAALLRATAVLDRLEGIEFPVMAELGVFVAMMSRRLLARKDLHLFMVDSWSAVHSEEYHATNDFHAKLSTRKQEGFYLQSKNIADQHPDQATILRYTTREAANHIADASLDLVFIDADHSYEGCRDDIKNWLPKVKPGGWLSGHDYENNTQDFKFGVTQAVDEYIAESGKKLELGDNYTWFVKQ